MSLDGLAPVRFRAGGAGEVQRRVRQLDKPEQPGGGSHQEKTQGEILESVNIVSHLKAGPRLFLSDQKMSYYPKAFRR